MVAQSKKHTAKAKPKPDDTEKKPDTIKVFDPVEFSQKLMQVMERAQPVIRDLLDRYHAQAKPAPSMTPLDPMHLRQATAELYGHYMRHPSQMVELQLKYWEDLSHLWQDSARKFMGEEVAPHLTPEPGDRRFRDPVWTENVAFDFIKQSYLMTRNWVQTTLDEAEELPEHDRQKLEFYTRQYLDALAPNNFAATNPEVIKETLRTGGENLVKGLQNLVEDMKRGAGDLKISTTKPEAFVFGKNIASTPGKVIFRNRMMELIQYSPTTPQVHKTPLLILPPWINKYYILDLRPDNSFVKHAIDQGFTVFIASWVNPDKSYKHVLFDDYMQDGLLAALDVIQNVTGEKTANVVGYCIGGTLTAMTMAWLARRKQSHRINSATLLTTLLDFEGAGDMKVFIDEQQIDDIEARMKEQGFLEAAALQKTFSILRANDLIWSFVINNYMLGREPFPFDLLFWNEDSTNLPAAMHAYYLRHLYLRNDLIKPDQLSIGGTKIDLTKIKTPCYFLSTREDHIAPWLATYSGAQLVSKNAPIKFVLASSGHVAGVINPPANKKYGYWTSTAKLAGTEPDAWVDSADYTEGSWWTDWAKWVKGQSGPKIKARTKLGSTKYKPTDDAPGSYVRKHLS